MTLGPGSYGGSITSDNITPLHLLNVKRMGEAIQTYRDLLREGVPALPKSNERRSSATPQRALPSLDGTRLTPSARDKARALGLLEP
jgi:hypothetical protein